MAALMVDACVVDGAPGGGIEGGAEESGGGAETSASTTSEGGAGDGEGSTTEGGSSESTTDDEAGGGSSTGAEPEGSGSTGEPELPPGGVPMFVALGQGGRRVVSCDDGHSWGAEQTIDGDNSDHGPYSSRAITWGEGAFVIGMGWGNPGTLWRSEDGIAWDETFPPPGHEPTGLSGVVYGEGRFVAVEGRRAWFSDDGAVSWTRGDDLPSGQIVRTVGFSPYGGGRYYAVGAGDIRVSPDGLTWGRPDSVEGSCDGNVTRRGGVASLDDVFVVVTDTGNVCRSEDGGVTFSHHEVGPGPGNGSVVDSNVVVTEDGVYAAGGGGAWSSADGTQWQSVSFELEGERIRRLAISDQGTLIGIAWSGDDFYRSEDGQTWSRVDDAPSGNDITQVIFGYATPSATCPE